MKKVLKNLYRSPFDFPFGKKEKGLSCKSEAWFLVSPFGNTLFYSSRYIEDHFDFITQKGGLSLQMLNHRHEASPYSDRVFEKFQAPLICHHLEKEAVIKKCKVEKTMSGGETFGNIKTIHTPGHCPGSTCFFVNQDGENILFSGDTLYPCEGQWYVTILKEHREEMIQSLKKLLELDVSLIAPSIYVGYPPFEKFKNKKAYQTIIKNCISRLEKGETH